VLADAAGSVSRGAQQQLLVNSSSSSASLLNTTLFSCVPLSTPTQLLTRFLASDCSASVLYAGLSSMANWTTHTLASVWWPPGCGTSWESDDSFPDFLVRLLHEINEMNPKEKTGAATVSQVSRVSGRCYPLPCT
jgi:hypothetical protein